MTTHQVLKFAAIDQGFFSTKIAYGTSTSTTGQVIDTDQFPSWSVNGLDFAKNSQTSNFGSNIDGATVVVDGQRYFVGKSALQASTREGGQRIAHGNYSRSPEYRALFLGALFYICKRREVTGSLTINTLALGLPVSTFFAMKDELAAMAKGTHEIPSPNGDGSNMKVHIKEVHVVCQPMGAALNYAYNRGERLNNDRIVVLDMGGGTFDWFFLDRLTANYNRSNAAQLGVLSCVTAICDHLDAKYKSAPLVIDRINDALVSDAKTVRIDGYVHKMEDLWPVATRVLHSAVSEMAKSVGNFVEVDAFLFTGGGAELLLKASKEKGSSLVDEERKFAVDSNPVYSNVCGFYRLAEMVSDQ